MKVIYVLSYQKPWWRDHLHSLELNFVPLAVNNLDKNVLFWIPAIGRKDKIHVAVANIANTLLNTLILSTTVV